MSGYTYTWNVDYIYVQIIDNRPYNTIEEAGRACAKNPKCRGINMVGDKFKLAGGDKMKPSKGGKSYIRGGYDYTSTSIYYADNIWNVKSPYGITGRRCTGKTVTTRNEALRWCRFEPRCKAFTFQNGRFMFWESTKLIEKAGSVSLG